MIKIYEYYPDYKIFSTLLRKLSWSHFVELLQIQDKTERKFYTVMCQNEIWSVRTLRERIDSALYKRTIISRKPEETLEQKLIDSIEAAKIQMEQRKKINY